MSKSSNVNDQLLQLKQKEQQLQEKLKKILSIGEADHPMESRYPTGRFDLENEIEFLKIRLTQVQEELRELGKKP